MRGNLIDWIHEAGQLHAQGELAGLIFNAGAYTHTSIALMDAVKGTGVPLLELHISNVHAREAFRHQLLPVTRSACSGLWPGRARLCAGGGCRGAVVMLRQRSVKQGASR